MNWFKRKHWKKIGEVVDGGDMGYKLYAIMEHIKVSGDRQYKRVLICKWSAFDKRPVINSQPDDPLKEIHDILNH